ncbi:hypothetical protein J1N35_012799 [Gossypium stocksii]|uniref:Retrotransposon Copia-like N-terminal domain-containing protein n=1 Tax=Gossypium stocksii TaxID=47602 RepID=A0A9D3W4Y8_9ROSI|nr:hypothetical protein J1N35_012799 [Gossypium stocksii]
MVKTTFTRDKRSNNQMKLTSHKLNDKNYLEWSQSVKLTIDERDKLGPLIGEVKQPQVSNQKMSKWSQKIL